MVRRSRNASGKRPRRHSRHSMKSRSVRRMRHTRGRGRVMKGGMLGAMSSAMSSVSSWWNQTPPPPTTYYLTDHNRNTPYGVYNVCKTNRGVYGHGRDSGYKVTFNRWDDGATWGRDVKNQIYNDNTDWGLRFRSGDTHTRKEITLTLGEIVEHYDEVIRQSHASAAH